MHFEFATAGRIIFGPGTFDQIGDLAATFGTHALVVGGATRSRIDPLLDRLHARGIATTLVGVRGEPTTESILTGLAQARAGSCDLVVSMGGGSVLDTGKAIAALLRNDGDLLDYLEVVGRGQPLRSAAAPHIAIPTTAGTGSEVTRNAVIGVEQRRVKVSLRSALMLPSIALVDPALTLDLPPHITAQTGLDALTQCIEPLVSAAANPLTDALCRDGIMRAARSFRRACTHGDDLAARTDMLLTSLFGGLALANARLGAVHGLAGPIGGMFTAPHGALCGRLLPFVMRANVAALRQRTPESPALDRYDQIARLLTGDTQATADAGVAWIAALCDELAIPPLGSYGITPDAVPAIVDGAQQASSMRGNPIALTGDELAAIVEQAIQPRAASLD